MMIWKLKIPLLIFAIFFIIIQINYGKNDYLNNENEEYNDTFTRNILYPLSAAAFSSNPNNCLNNILKNYTVNILKNFFII